MTLTLKVKRLTETAKLPTYAHDGDACFDLYADKIEYSEDGRVALISTGISFDIPDGYALMVYSRSGHGFKYRVRLSNCVGVIDSGYKGELKVNLHGDEYKHMEDRIYLNKYDRIAQAMLIPVPVVVFEEVTELSGSERGEGGFGSSGR